MYNSTFLNILPFQWSGYVRFLAREVTANLKGCNPQTPNKSVYERKKQRERESDYLSLRSPTHRMLNHADTVPCDLSSHTKYCSLIGSLVSRDNPSCESLASRSTSLVPHESTAVHVATTQSQASYIASRYIHRLIRTTCCASKIKIFALVVLSVLVTANKP